MKLVEPWLLTEEKLGRDKVFHLQYCLKGLCFYHREKGGSLQFVVLIHGVCLPVHADHQSPKKSTVAESALASFHKSLK